MEQHSDIHTRTTERTAAYVQQFGLKDVRAVFQHLRRTPNCHPDMLLPHFGLTFGQFCTFYTIQHKRTR